MVNAALDKFKRQNFEYSFQKWVYRLKKCIGNITNKYKKKYFFLVNQPNLCYAPRTYMLALVSMQATLLVLY